MIQLIKALIVILCTTALLACGGGVTPEEDERSFNVSLRGVSINDANNQPISVDVSGISNDATLK